MSLEKLEEAVATARALFEKIFASLPQIAFDSRWVNANDQLTPVAAAIGIDAPCTSIDPSNSRRVILIPTNQFGVIAVYDKWPNRGAMSPLAAVHPHGFDMIDYPFEMMAVPASQVADDFAVTGEGIESEALTPIFDRLLNEVLAGKGDFVRFPAQIVSAAA